MIRKDKIERLVINQLQNKVLTDENLDAVVKLVNEELQMTANEMVNRIPAVDLELRNTQMRLSKLYDALG